MAQLTITIPDAVAARVGVRYGEAHGYTGTGPDGQPETRTQFLRRGVIRHIRDSVKSAEVVAATRAAAEAAAAAAESEVTLS